jgi:AAA family ATP:ADP antiporter
MKTLLQLFTPLRKEEITKFLVISSMMLIILFIYSIERTVKDTIVINEMGAELISGIKLYGTLPIAVLMMLIYTKLSNEINKTTIFHLFNGFFLSYFLIFTFILAPNIKHFYLNLSKIKIYFPFMGYCLNIIESWPYSLYFVLAELWGSIMLSLMYWQTVNQIYDVADAKRIYPLLGLVAQFGMITSGELLRLFSNKNIFKGGWQQSLQYINLSVLFVGLILSGLYWLLTNVIVDKNIINAEVKKKKKKMGFFQSIKYIATSKYIGLISLLILCYGVSVNLVEGIWKAQISAVYIEKQDYARFMANLQTFTGIVSMIAMLLGSYLFSFASWKVSAFLTPIIIFVTGTIFYLFAIYQTEITSAIPGFNFPPIIIAVFLGLLQNVLGKATKYAFFDSTKEMAYIPLDEALKSKGKAAADVIGGRLGKSGGALTQQLLLTMAFIQCFPIRITPRRSFIIIISYIIFNLFYNNDNLVLFC